jgi:hypothetical protein
MAVLLCLFPLPLCLETGLSLGISPFPLAATTGLAAILATTTTAVLGLLFLPLLSATLCSPLRSATLAVLWPPETGSGLVACVRPLAAPLALAAVVGGPAFLLGRGIVLSYANAVFLLFGRAQLPGLKAFRGRHLGEFWKPCLDVVA